MYFLLGRICFAFVVLLSLGPIAVAQDATSVAADQIGKPYGNGDDGPDSFDCSGLTQYSYAQVGVTLPRTSIAQSAAGSAVTDGIYQRGDLLFFAIDDRHPGVVTHVGIFESGTHMIHAPGRGRTVERTDLNGRARAYWRSRFVTARRIQQQSVATVTIAPGSPSIPLVRQYSIRL